MVTNRSYTKNSIKIDQEVEKVSKCLICGNPSHKLLFQGKDDRYDYPKSFPIVKCIHCGFVYLGSRPHESQLSTLYQRYYSLVNHQENKQEQLPSWKLLLKKSIFMKIYHWLNITQENLYSSIPNRSGIRILDIGSGTVPENASKILRSGGEWLAVEIDERKCHLLANAGYKSFWGTLEDFQTTDPAPFDYIVLSQVLEHVYQPREFLSSCRLLLRPGGKIILSCPNHDSFMREQHGKQWLHWHVPYHVAHYSRYSLTLLAESIGFSVAKFYTFTPVTWFFAQKKVARGIPYNDKLLCNDRLRWGQRLLDIYLVPHHLLHRGDALFAELEIVT